MGFSHHRHFAHVAHELQHARMIGSAPREFARDGQTCLEALGGREGVVDAQAPVAVEHVERLVLLGFQREGVVAHIVAVGELQQHEVRPVADRLRFEHHVLLRRAVARDAEIQHLDALARLEAAARQALGQQPPISLLALDLHRLGVRVAQHHDGQIRLLSNINCFVYFALFLRGQRFGKHFCFRPPLALDEARSRCHQ